MTLYTNSTDNRLHGTTDLLSRFSNIPRTITYVKGDLEQLPEFSESIFVLFKTQDNETFNNQHPKCISDRQIDHYKVSPREEEDKVAPLVEEKRKNTLI
jgi:hypothetical protein